MIKSAKQALTPLVSSSWLLRITQFLMGQGVVRLINIIIGLILLRILPIEEFALYTLTIVFIQASSLVTNMGLSHAINTFGANLRKDPQRMGFLYRGACFFAHKFYFVVIIIVPIALVSMTGHEWSWMHISIALLLLLVTVRIDISYKFYVSMMNAHHQSKNLFHTGMVEALMRLVLLWLCVVWPFAIVALFGNLIGIVGGRLLASSRCKKLMEKGNGINKNQNNQLKSFIMPLMPVVVYEAIQSQLALFLLGVYGYTASIAEVGALGRLGQVIGLFILLNSFFIQPVFARIHDKQEFIKKAIIVIVLILLFSFVCMGSVYLLPQWWLLIIGSHYAGLQAELPIAVMIGLLTWLGGVLYTLIISRGVTLGQGYYILVALLAQVVFLSVHGISSTYDALLLNLLPVATYACVQVLLLVRMLYKW